MNHTSSINEAAEEPKGAVAACVILKGKAKGTNRAQDRSCQNRTGRQSVILRKPREVQHP